MRVKSAVIRCAYIVDKALKSIFPDNYFARCMYASYGSQHILQKLGFRTRIIGGSFGMFLVSADGRRATIDAYGGPGAENSHVWCVVEDRIFDVSSPYLAENGSFPKAIPPIVFWPVDKEMPRSFRYYYGGDHLSPATYDPDVQERLAGFIEHCDKRLSAHKGQPNLRNWLLTDMTSIRRASQKGDPWASAALRLEAGDQGVDFRSMLLHGDLQERIPVVALEPDRNNDACLTRE
ncbi:hypothetical protein [Roseovarius mucosus]|uniref:hypothetical protein n=1 Tax=Roseovarius mucosus TaxID=215743 RepID=UPI0035CEC088